MYFPYPVTLSIRYFIISDSNYEIGACSTKVVTSKTELTILSLFLHVTIL